MTEVGLRERKRERTRRRLEEAAIGLALRDGLDKVTIDAISARADVSPRTFFNYFDSKEDAILGVLPADINDEILAAHRIRYAQSDLVEILARFDPRMVKMSPGAGLDSPPPPA